jgi:hypothetical protein
MQAIVTVNNASKTCFARVSADVARWLRSQGTQIICITTRTDTLRKSVFVGWSGMEIPPPQTGRDRFRPHIEVSASFAESMNLIADATVLLVCLIVGLFGVFFPPFFFFFFFFFFPLVAKPLFPPPPFFPISFLF